METLAADPLADLQLEGADERLAQMDRERMRDREAAAEEKWGVQARTVTPTIGPPSPPLPASARWCACTNPWLDPTAPASCVRCGKNLRSGADDKTLGSSPERDQEPLCTSAGSVPWTPDQERELAELVRSRQSTQFDLGDLILQAVPNGGSRARNGSGALLAELGRRVGLEAASVRRLRATSAAWPADTRVNSASWSAHATYIRGGSKAAPARARQLRDLADGGRVSADMVRANILQVQRCRPTVDPFRSFLNRVNVLHGAVAELPDVRSKSGHASVRILRRRAEQAREIADRLERLAA